MRTRRNFVRARITTTSVVILIAVLGAAASMAGADEGAGRPRAGGETGGTGSEGVASFEGRQIDLAVSWEGAGACIVWQLDDIQCFKSERELEQHVIAAEDTLSTETSTLSTSAELLVTAAASSSCGSYLRLYDYTSYGGSSLWLASRYTWLNLANYGFNQRTSSFRVGGCSAYFADLASGGGAWYPTSLTQAWDSSPSMISGWNNDVSSVYIT